MNPILLDLFRQSPAFCFFIKQGKIPDSLKEKIKHLSSKQEEALIKLLTEEQIQECKKKEEALLKLETQIKKQMYQEDDQSAENALLKLSSL